MLSSNKTFKSFRYTTALSVSIIALSVANQAQAQCAFTPGPAATAGNDVVNCSGTSTGILSLGAGDDQITITDSYDGRINFGSGANTVVNNGSIINTGANGDLLGNGTNSYSLTNTGTISSDDSTVINSTGPGTVINSGTIENTAAGGNTDTIRFTGLGVHAGESIIIDNQATGVISSASNNATAATIEVGTGTLENVTVTNAGSITAGERAIRITGTTLNSFNLTNTGTINGVNDSIFNDTGSTSTIINSNVITGDIDLSAGTGVATITNNAGATITGDIDTGADNDIVTNAGTITGRVYVTAGSDTITNSATGVIENLGTGPTGDNAIRITGGDLAGGLDNDGRITAVFNPAIEIRGTDVTGLIDNSGIIEGTEPLISGSGIEVSNSADISGGVTNQADGIIRGTLTAFAIAGSSDVSGQIQNDGLIGSSAATVFGLSVESVSDLSGGLVNNGTISAKNSGVSASSSSNISGGIVNNGTIIGTRASGVGIEVEVASDISGVVTNNGTITGGAAGVKVSASTSDMSGGIINNGTISGIESTGTGILVESTADISGGITNNTGGVITGMREGILVGTSNDLTGAITNSGTISGGRGGIYLGGSAVDISGGVINNAGGVITADTGVFVSSSSAISGGIVNSGTIEGTMGTAINLTDLSAATPITINGGRIIGDVTDGNIGSGFSPVTVTGSGYKTEGNFTVSDLIVNAGQDFTISSDNTVTLNDMSVSAGTLIYELGAGSVAQLNVTGAGNDIDITGATIEAFNNGRVLNDGDEILIGTGVTDVNGGAGQALTSITDNSLLFDISIADGGDAAILSSVDTTSLFLKIVAASAGCSDSATTTNGQNPCDPLDTLSGTSDAELLKVIANLGAASTQEELEEVLQAVLPQIDGSAFAAAQNVTGNTLRLVSDRLTVIRDGGGGSTGISSGDLTENLQMWGQVFGQKIDQGKRSNVAGYDAITRGMTIGADTDSFYDDATVGLAFSYANTDVKSNGVNNTRSEIDSYNVSLYGDYDLSDNTYLVGDLGYTYGDNEATRFNVGGVSGLNANSDYGSHQMEARLIAAKDYHPTEYKGVRVTPKAQVHYIRYQNEDISETGAGGASLNVDSEALNILEFGVGVDVRKDYVQEDGSILSPEVNIGYRYDVIGDPVNTTSTFNGGGASFKSEGVDPDQDTLNLGFGVGYTTTSGTEFTFSYDYENKDEFNSHSGLIRLAAPF